MNMQLQNILKIFKKPKHGQQSTANDCKNLSDVHIVDLESITVEKAQDKNESTEASCVGVSMPVLVVLGLILIYLVLGRQYVKDILLYIDTLDIYSSTVLFAVMFTIVAFPLMWGYGLLNLAAGYTYGFVYGTMITSGCVVCAITCAHFIIRKFFKNYTKKMFIVNSKTKALMDVVSGPNGYKIVFLSRFTPIPFGVQNAMFAVSDISYIPYIISSFFGLLVSQAVLAYIGSTLRSMTEVMDDEHSVTAWIILSVQMIATLGLSVFIFKLAKTELDKSVMPENTQSSSSQSPDKLTETRAIQTVMQKSHSHSRNLSVNIPPIVSSNQNSNGLI